MIKRLAVALVVLGSLMACGSGGSVAVPARAADARVVTSRCEPSLQYALSVSINEFNAANPIVNQTNTAPSGSPAGTVTWTLSVRLAGASYICTIHGIPGNYWSWTSPTYAPALAAKPPTVTSSPPQNAQCEADVKAVAGAIYAYIAVNGKRPDGWGSLIPAYLRGPNFPTDVTVDWNATVPTVAGNLSAHPMVVTGC